MKQYFTLSVFLFLILSKIHAQDSLNMTVLSNWNPTTTEFNDIWGHVDANGNEYAIIGSLNKIHIFKIESNNSVTLIEEFTPGSSSIWRDFKVYQDTLYAVADQYPGTEGLVIIDLSNLPTSASLVSQDNGVFGRSHNIFIDEAKAKLYVTGSNTQSNGLHIYDLTPHPDTLLASVPLLFSGSVPGYAHDIYVRNDTVYASHGYDGFYIWDMTDPTNPMKIASKVTGGYNHSSWVTDDGNYAFFAEEVPLGQPLGVMDLTNLDNPSPTIAVVNTFKFPLLAPAYINNRPHNPFIIGDSLYVSYYHDGMQVFNISDPMNVTQDAYYDTHPANNLYTSYYGAWGSYPFLPSGKILVSDIDSGLFVVEMIPPTAPLPIELKNFNANLVDEKVLVTWTTLSETDNDFFEIEKSKDGREFFVVEKIDGAGTSSQQNNYKVWDNDPFRGENYYRLKQTDTDGKFSYSEIEFVFAGNPTLKIYPTILSNDAPLQIELTNEQTGSGDLRILTTTGQEVFHQKLTNSMSHSISLSFLENGQYILYFKNEKTEQVVKLTVLK